MKVANRCIGMGLLTLLLAAGLALVGCAREEEPNQPAEPNRAAPDEGMGEPIGTEPDQTIVEVARDAGSFGTLITALQAAGLVDTLEGDGPYTVFAPRDQAFQKLPDGTLEQLLLPTSRDRLQGILTYHVASGELMAADVAEADQIETLEGGMIDVSVSGGTVMLNGEAQVVQTDIAASNGVIHVIDTVLMPPEE